MILTSVLSGLFGTDRWALISISPMTAAGWMSPTHPSHPRYSCSLLVWLALWRSGGSSERSLYSVVKQKGRVRKDPAFLIVCRGWRVAWYRYLVKYGAWLTRIIHESESNSWIIRLCCRFLLHIPRWNESSYILANVAHNPTNYCRHPYLSRRNILLFPSIFTRKFAVFKLNSIISKYYIFGTSVE